MHSNMRFHCLPEPALSSTRIRIRQCVPVCLSVLTGIELCNWLTEAAVSLLSLHPDNSLSVLTGIELCNWLTVDLSCCLSP